MHGHDWKWQRPTGWHFKFWPIPKLNKNSNEKKNERNSKTDRVRESDKEREGQRVRLFKVLWKYDTDLSLGNWYNQMRI